MALLTWKDSYSVGVKEIDAQHQKIFELINKLYSSMVNMTEKDIAKEIINELVNYADYHFTTEEKYFELYNYPGKEPHIKKHKQYVEDVERLRKEVMKNDKVISMKILNFLEDWWSEHILIIDKKYETFFTEHGLN